MNEFDELLNSILHEDANPQAPAGMAQRVVARLEQQKRRAPNSKDLWLGVAAALLLGLASWTFTHARTVIPAAHTKAAIAQTPAAALGPPVDLRTASPSPGPRSVPARWKLAGNSARAHPLFAQHDIHVAPIDINPIVIQPIEIAAVAQKNPR